MMMLLPFSVMASENKVYLDKSIGGTTSWNSITGYDYRYSLGEYLKNHSMTVSGVKKVRYLRNRYGCIGIKIFKELI